MDKFTNLADKTLRTAEKHPNLAESAHDLFLSTLGFVLKKLVQAELQRFRPENQVVEENDQYIATDKLMERGIAEFQKKHPEISVIWQPSNQKIDLSQFLSMLNRTFSEEELRLFGEVRESSMHDRSLFAQFIHIYRKFGTADISFMQKLLPQELAKQLSSAYKGRDFGAPLYTESLHQSLEAKVEAKVQQEGKKIGFSEILIFFLELTQGKLDEALEIATFFLKKQRYDKPGKGEWIQSHIRDEQSPILNFDSLVENPEAGSESIRPSFFDRMQSLITGEPNHELASVPLFNKLAALLQGKDSLTVRDSFFNFNIENHLGRPYHQAHLVSLLKYFPPEAVSFFTLGEYAMNLQQHGSVKLFADILILRDLRKVSKLLEKYKV